MPKKNVKTAARVAARKEVRKELQKVVPGQSSDVQEMRNKRGRTRLDASTESALAYLKGLIDPINHGAGVRLPSDGMFPTSTASSFNRFVLPVATQTGGSNSNRTAGLMVMPDVQFQYCTLTTINIDNHSSVVWSSPTAGGAWSTVSSNAAFYRGCVNMAVTLTCQAPLLKRGGRLVASLLPPGGSVSDIDSVFAYNRTVVLDLAKLGEQTSFFWLPATGEAGVAIAGGAGATAFYRTASMWTSPACSAWPSGDPSWVFFLQTSDNTSVALDFTVQINNNFEFIPSFGGASQVFSTKLVVGGDADSTAVLKPLEATAGPSVLEQVATGAMNAVDSVGQAFTQLGKSSGVPFMGAAGSAISGLGSAGKNLLRGDFAQATYDFLGAGLSALPLFGAEAQRQHRVAMTLGLPDLSPLSTHVPGQPISRFAPTVMDPEKFDDLVALRLRRKPRLQVSEPDWDEEDLKEPHPSPSASAKDKALRANSLRRN